MCSLVYLQWSMRGGETSQSSKPKPLIVFQYWVNTNLLHTSYRNVTFLLSLPCLALLSDPHPLHTLNYEVHQWQAGNPKWRF